MNNVPRFGLFVCPFCNQGSPVEGNNPRFCNHCFVFVDEVAQASLVVRKAMAQFCRKLATEKPTKAALAQAATWEKAAGISATDTSLVKPRWIQ